MKKLMLLFAGMLMLGIVAVNAQQVDTTGVTPSTQQQQPSATQQPADQYIQKDYDVVKSADVPSSLRTTLKGSEYTGWESGSVYRNKTTNGYMVRIGSGDQTKNYYFDKGGKRIQDPGSSSRP